MNAALRFGIGHALYAMHTRFIFQAAVRAVAFDLDGLMFNTEEIYVDVAGQMLNRRGHELDMDVIHQMMGRPAKTGLPIMMPIRWAQARGTTSTHS